VNIEKNDKIYPNTKPSIIPIGIKKPYVPVYPNEAMAFPN